MSRVGVLAVAVLAGALGAAVMWVSVRSSAPPVVAAHAVEAEVWQCPMHPQVIQDHPGNCPICSMKLVKQTAVAKASEGALERPGIVIDSSRQQLIGLRTAPATVGPIAGQWRTVGRVEVDPTRVRTTNVKVEGYVEHVFVDFVGRPVRRGERLFTLYSPELLAAQNEYLLALKTREALQAGAFTGNGDVLVASAKRKLELWDVPSAEIEQLERTLTPTKTLTFVSPISGVVTAKKVVEGARLAPGDTPYEITDLSMVWVMADAYENDLARVKVGTPATLTLNARPDHPFRGEVAFIDPLLDATTRTAKVHLHFDNGAGELKPEMFGEVTLETPSHEALRVPLDAVVHAGDRDVVFVALGEGRFEPRTVQLGLKTGELVEVTGGLDAGTQVVTRANFLIDSESQLRSALSTLGNSK